MAATIVSSHGEAALQANQQSGSRLALRMLCGLGIVAGLYMASYCCWSSTLANLHAPVAVMGSGNLYKLQQSVTAINNLDCIYHLIFGFGLAVFSLCSLNLIERSADQ